MRYRDAVREGRRLVKRSEEDQWRLAELTAEVLDQGKSTRQWASDIDVSHVYVVRLRQVWERFGGNPVTDRPPFKDAYNVVRNATPAAPTAPKPEVPAPRTEAGDDGVRTFDIRHPGHRTSQAPPPVRAPGHAPGWDQATVTLRTAASLVADAVFQREQFGIHQPEQEREALERLVRAVDAYRAGVVTDADRSWLESIGVTHTPPNNPQEKP